MRSGVLVSDRTQLFMIIYSVDFHLRRLESSKLAQVQKRAEIFL